MIERYIVSELGTISELRGQAYPVAAPIGDIDCAFCIYTRVSGDVERDLLGNLVFYRDVYRLDLFCEDADLLFELSQSVIGQLTKNNVEFDDLYIFSATAAPGGADGFDLTIETHQRSISYILTYWR
jgi:hypothetical protein